MLLLLNIWRVQAGPTQREAAFRLRIGESTYGFLESGRMRPPHSQLVKLSHFFKNPLAMFEPVHDVVETTNGRGD
jgi:transcriptional regulator with XRE-family HTH domain